MDLERIKQNFRIRSGRARKPRKHHKPNGVPPQPKDSSNTTAPPPRSQTPEKETEHATATTSPSTVNNESTAGGSHETTPSSVGEPLKDNGQQADSIDESPKTTDSSLLRARSDSLNSQGSSLDLQPADPSQTMANASATANGVSSDPDDFDLPPPKPRNKPPSTENLSELLFSQGHLESLLQHTPQLTRFSAFLQKYSPEHYPMLAQYLETRKAVKAVEYANAVAEGFKPKETGGDHSTDTRSMAAKLDPEFEAICNASVQALMDDALPNYISYSLVKVASEIMTNEITGRSTPIMRDLVDGLSEVFCLTDPNQEDNPIIYASEEFYRFTRYGPDDVLNHNCRFLQGRKTNPTSPKRLKHAITTGGEISETLLNYKRDGRPFINLLMIAPLYDRNGKLKYHIGAQIDVTGMVQGGRALDGFQRYLARRGDDKRREEIEKADTNLDDDQRRKKRALARLRDLSETFDLEEAAVVQASSRSNSLTREDDDTRSLASVDRQKGQRRVYIDSNSSDDEDVEDEEAKKNNDTDWKLGDSGDGKLAGKLPGVYDSFILFRPAPSFRIVFISPKLRKLGSVVQSPFLSHVAAPNSTLNGLAESLRSGVPVSAKIHFKPERGERREGTRLKNGSKHEDGKNGRAIWVSCTPLLGEDEAIGVWMCVVIEKSRVGSIKDTRDVQSEGFAEETGAASQPKADKAEKAAQDQQATIGSEESSLKREDVPIKPVRINSQTVIKTQVEKSPESAEAGQDQKSKTVRPQQSIYFDAEQDNNIDPQDNSDCRETDQAVPSEEDALKDDQTLEPPPTRERDPRAVVTPVPEYEGEESGPEDYEFDAKGSSPSSVYRDEANDEYVATRPPATPTRQSNNRILIEEDSDVLQDSDLDHQRDNIRVGRSRDSSTSSRSLNSPASDIPPSVPSSAMVADEGDDDDDFDLTEKVDGNDTVEGKDEPTPEDESKPETEPEESKSDDRPDDNNITPTVTRHDRSPSPPDKKDNEENGENLEESQATIKPGKDQSPARNSDHDSSLSLNSPAQHKVQSTSQSGSRSPSAETTPQKPTDTQEEGNRTPKNLDHAQEDESAIRERDIETWVTEGRPTTNRNNSEETARGQDPNQTQSQSHASKHTHTHNYSTSTNTVTRTVPGGLRLDFLGTGENRWAARQPRRRLDTESEDYGDDGGSDEGDDALTRSDHCATSPYSVD